MRKLIAAMNMTLDGYCDHTAGIADDEIHQHYTDLLNDGDAIIYGRVTYQLMEYWKPFIENPTGTKAMDDFALAIDGIKKIVYSRTLREDDWNNTELKREIVEAEILDLKQQDGNNIFVGSPSLIVALTNLQLIDEYQLAIHPMVIGSGLPLFKDVKDRLDLKLLRTKTFGSGVVIHYYERRSAVS
jgi:dihydrofolate reductase